MEQVLEPLIKVETNGYDGTFVVYRHHVRAPEGLLTYTGKSSSGTKRPQQEYVRNVRRILEGRPYRMAGGYRGVHFALAAAVIEGWEYTCELVDQAADKEDLLARESARAAEISAVVSLNGSRARDSVDGFRQIIARHLRSRGHSEETVQDVVRVGRNGQAMPIQDRAKNETFKPERRSISEAIAFYKSGLASELGLNPDQIEVTIKA